MAQIIIRPIVTEKMTAQGEKEGRYGFVVAKTSNKVQIKQAVEQLFNKKVLSVNTSNYAGKAKRTRTAHYGRKAHWKKAIITLKEGEKISFA